MTAAQVLDLGKHGIDLIEPRNVGAGPKTAANARTTLFRFTPGAYPWVFIDLCQIPSYRLFRHRQVCHHGDWRQPLHC